MSSGKGIVANLDKQKYAVLSIKISKTGEWIGQNGGLLTNKNKDDFVRSVNVVFLALHGRFGEDGTVQAHLEKLGIPYTGSNSAASKLCLNKYKTFATLKKAGFTAPDHILMKKASNIDISQISLPCVVLPNKSGSSIGVSVCKKRDQLSPALDLAFEEDNEVIISEYLNGTEITVSILGNDILPIIEIQPQLNEFYDYRSKYEEDGSLHIIPARLSKVIYKKAEEAAIKVHEICGCSGYSRVDMIVKDGMLYILEINTLPGMTPTSLLPHSASHAGLSYSQLLDRMIELV